MRAVDLIERKRQGGELTPDEIKWFVTGFLSGEVEVYQVTAWLMAVYFQGLTPQETSALASAMAYSGETYNWDGLFDARVVDKHSSGGVGDKVSLILAPLVAAMGMTDPMISGRGLGHTGGTLDKLESIPGFNVFPGRAQFERQLKEIGTVMCGQTDNFVPADKMLYSLRDVTATVPSVPLISASIISKKFAAGVQSLLLDVKAGSGAFMKTTADAEKLALALKHTGEGLGMEIRVLITDMNQPLGRMIGNSLEVAESIDVLHGVGPADLRSLVIEQAAEMLLFSDLKDAPETLGDCRTVAKKHLDDGSAWSKFIQLVKAQNGDIAVVEDPLAKLDIAPGETYLTAPRAGWIEKMDCGQIGTAACLLGAGRATAADSVDHGVGLEMLVRVGDEVFQKQSLVRIIHRNGRGLSEAMELLRKSIVIGDAAPEEVLPLVHKRI